MCCCDICVEIGVEALKLVGDFVAKCLIPGILPQKAVKYQSTKQGLGYRAGLKSSNRMTPVDPLNYSDELLQTNIIVNPKFTEGTTGWSAVGCSLSVACHHGTSYCIARGRTESHQGLAQDIGKRLDANVEYRIEVWAGIRGGQAGQAPVQTIVKVEKSPGGDAEYILLSRQEISKGQWCLLVGTLRLNELPKTATLCFNGPDGGIDILFSSVAIVQKSTTMPSVEVMKENHQPQIVSPKLSKQVDQRPVLDAKKLGVNIVANSNFKNGLDGWYAMGSCSLNVLSGGPRFVSATAQKSFVSGRAPTLSGNYVYASNRTQIWEGPAQDITDQIELFRSYQVFAWVATTTSLSLGSTNSIASQKVNVALDVDGQWMQGGEVLAGSEWSEVSGSFRLEIKPKKVQVYIQGPAPGVDVKLAGLQIFAVDRLARVPLLQQRTDQIRKRDMILKLRDLQGRLLPAGTKVSVHQEKNSFPLGTCINHVSLQDSVYREFFLDNFNWAVFDYELKWDQVEAQKGQENYQLTDDMVRFCNDNAIAMRGHCLVWGEGEWMQPWVKNLQGDDLIDAVHDRVSGLMERYRGQFRHYDVDNELLHSSFYQDRLGMDFLPYLFNLARQFDPQAKLFVNDFHVTDGGDCMSSPERYVELIKFLLSKGAQVGGIGVQGHVQVPIGPIISRALDVLSTLNIPLWFTEVDTPSLNEHVRADDLEVMLREAFAHPSVEGLLLWGFMENAMSNPNCHLVNTDKTINAAGQRLMALRKEWTTRIEGTVNDNGELVFRGFHGDYSLSVGNGVYKTFEVTKGDGSLVVDVSI